MVTANAAAGGVYHETARNGGAGRGLTVNVNASNANYTAAGVYSSGNVGVFCIPIYSGILGVLMPDKKLLPLSLLPLELELTVNPYGMYAVGNQVSRAFTITKCEIYSHTLFFE